MIKGIIFDMDGVISDTQKLHSKVESEILKRYNIILSPEEITRRYAGVKTKEFFYALLSQQDKVFNLDSLMEEKWSQMKKFASGSVDSIEGSIELIKDFHNSGFILAVASASNLDYVKTVLSKLGLKQYFSAVVSGDMVDKGKPDPESFLLASKKIEILPSNCLVIEDGISGMEAAMRAHMVCIGLVKDKSGSFPTNNLVCSLKEISVDHIKDMTK